MNRVKITPIEAFRHKLKAGRVCLGAGITFTDPLVTDALADSVDFIWMDLEHSAMSPETLHGHLLAARGKRKPAIVRAPGSGAALIKPVLDAGADGIVIPQVRSVAEVEQFVRDCRYPPLGTRGYGPRVPSNYGRAGGPEYVRRANRELFVAVMIETREAFEVIDSVVQVCGLDSIVVGPYDLSGGLGRLGEVEHPEVVVAIQRIIKTARAAGLFVGAGMGADAAFARRMIKRGVQWLQVGGDYRYLIERMEEIVRCTAFRRKRKPTD